MPWIFLDWELHGSVRNISQWCPIKVLITPSCLALLLQVRPSIHNIHLPHLGTEHLWIWSSILTALRFENGATYTGEWIGEMLNRWDSDGNNGNILPLMSSTLPYALGLLGQLLEMSHTVVCWKLVVDVISTLDVVWIFMNMYEPTKDELPKTEVANVVLSQAASGMARVNRCAGKRSGWNLTRKVGTSWCMTEQLKGQLFHTVIGPI